MTLKQPGVFVVEHNAFPLSVVQVATAVPAFIGYTATAIDGQGKAIPNRPWRISSIQAYERYFGGAPEPVFSFEPVLGAAAAGGASSESATAPRGQTSLIPFGGSTYRLHRAAARAGRRYLLHQALLHYFENGGADCFVVSVGDYTQEIEAGDDGQGLIGGLASLVSEPEPGIVVVPDAVLLSQADCVRVQQAMLAHCGGSTANGAGERVHNRVAILDIWGGDRSRSDPETGWDCISGFRNAIGTAHLSLGASYYPWLRTTRVAKGDTTYAILGGQVATLIDLLLAELGPVDSAPHDRKPRLQAQAALIARLGFSDDEWVASLITEAQQDPKLSKPDKKQRLADILQRAADPALKRDMLSPHKTMLHRAVLDFSPLYGRVMSEAQRLLNLMPPSAAVAGIYTATDTNRGVWKAPANMSLNGVTHAAVEVSDADQQDLNRPLDGKSVNAIRNFAGKGTLVWGGRTLDGNSPEWRYISVRRTALMLEESCRLALKAYVFEPNTANTWLTIRSMLENFLNGFWKQGGLLGSTPQDAYAVKLGLGETMTQADIAQGSLRINLLVALLRPAEFIVIRVEQRMQAP